MKIILAIVTSVDGKSTKGDAPPNSWASKEDQSYFFSQIKKNNLIVMGKNTYLAIKTNIKHSDEKLRIVLTHNPKQFEKDQIKGQLEFSSESPKALVQRLEKLGYKNMLLLSGPSLNTTFFKGKLIDELWLTLEPKIFGLGKGLVDEQKLNIELKLQSIKKLNTQGTLLLKYQVT